MWLKQNGQDYICCPFVHSDRRFNQSNINLSLCGDKNKDICLPALRRNRTPMVHHHYQFVYHKIPTLVHQGAFPYNVLSTSYHEEGSP